MSWDEEYQVELDKGSKFLVNNTYSRTLFYRHPINTDTFYGPPQCPYLWKRKCYLGVISISLMKVVQSPNELVWIEIEWNSHD